jgi:hypothetical protein
MLQPNGDILIADTFLCRKINFELYCRDLRCSLFTKLSCCSRHREEGHTIYFYVVSFCSSGCASSSVLSPSRPLSRKMSSQDAANRKSTIAIRKKTIIATTAYVWLTSASTKPVKISGGSHPRICVQYTKKPASS